MLRFARIRTRLEELFPERHLYVRSSGRMHAIVLSSNKQIAVAGFVAVCAAWMGVTTAAIAVNAVASSNAEREVARIRAQSERWIADREARLDSAVAQLNASEGEVGALAASIEKRHAALAMLLTEARGEAGAIAALAPTIAQAANPPASLDPERRIERVRASQERLIEAADDYARTRAERLRLAFRLAGVSPAAYSQRGQGGPLIESRDPRALAAVLDVDEAFAGRIQRAASNLNEARHLADAAEALPISRPTQNTAQSSGFGVRFDPFTRRPAYHSGLDFTGGFGAAILATAPGVVSFTGPRSGYGNTIEIDHGRGFKTRYAHLQAIGVTTGQRVAVGQRIGAMGSTGRSTGPHLHYEVWVNGRAQNPGRFIKAGDHVRQAS